MSGDIWLVLMLLWFSFQNKRNWCSWETFGKWWPSFQQLSWTPSKLGHVEHFAIQVPLWASTFRFLPLNYYLPSCPFNYIIYQVDNNKTTEATSLTQWTTKRPILTCQAFGPVFFPLFKTLSNQKQIRKQLEMWYFCMYQLHYQGSKNIWIPPFPMGKKLSHFACPG